MVGAMDEVVAGLGTAVAPGTQTLLLIPVLVSTNDCEGIALWGTWGILVGVSGIFYSQLFHVANFEGLGDVAVLRK